MVVYYPLKHPHMQIQELMIMPQFWWLNKASWLFVLFQCNIAHALEKTKYPDSDIYWQKFEEKYHFSCQFTADLIAMNHADFIITSTYQEIAGRYLTTPRDLNPILVSKLCFKELASIEMLVLQLYVWYYESLYPGKQMGCGSLVSLKLNWASWMKDLLLVFYC